MTRHHFGRALFILLGGLLLLPAHAAAQEEVVYYHTDAIGSVRAITDHNGDEIARYDYLPFGELWPTDPPQPNERRQFAGKERDFETTGLDYFGARYHRPVSGRFTTVDPVMNIQAALADPQRWNRYAYSRNNPLVFIDPDGRDIMSPATFQTQAFAQRVGEHLSGLSKAFVNLLQSVNSPGHMTLEAAAQHFQQPSTRGEAAIMQLFDAGMMVAPALGTLRGLSTGMIDANIVRFTQNSIGSTFRAGGSVDDLAAGLSNGTVSPHSLPPIRLVYKDGQLYSLDNRRLYAGQEAGVQLPYRMATPEEIAREFGKKFTTTNGGVSVERRK